YKLPSFSEMPEVFNVEALADATEPGAVYGSKAVGEPPLPLAISVRGALRQAAAACGPGRPSLALAPPATPAEALSGGERARAAGPTGGDRDRSAQAVQDEQAGDGGGCGDGAGTGMQEGMPAAEVLGVLPSAVVGTGPHNGHHTPAPREWPVAEPLDSVAAGSPPPVSGRA